ncbi:hypothetical protein [Lentibacillus jeotgali]|uniref:hypothetical protein n=1 Tax=Lentibacillus jeotgali TaxID=558169 RepID=UPI000262589D|nr:hypothetical protein [Lentibacillus jeotgali]
MANVFTETQKLIDKAEQVRQKFEASKQKAKEDAEKLEESIQELEKQEKETYSLYIMNDIDVSAYHEIKQQTDAKRQELATLQQKVNDIDGLEQYELSKVYAEYQEIEKELQKEERKQYAETLDKLKEAKQQYLKQIIDISNEQFKTYLLKSKMADVAVDGGLKTRNYIDYPSPYVDGFGHEFGTGKDYLNIGNRELSTVYRQRKLNPKI